ncbi:MAG TPA: 3-hydroxyacyl-CoA dehydrogenase NAD-binding domain-containing protein [Hyphomicrobiaceae bacterium]|nr:3-hydroxyacyl-CoA dehydrogenase NAD-binding domain-containing protein [Hyphomicrobiaceae bacterium]
MTPTRPPVTRETRDGLALIWIDNPPVNALSQGVRAGLKAAFGAAIADGSVEAIVLACRGRTFVAGADIREFGKPPLPPPLYELCLSIEASPKPIVAAIHGSALGGGCEIALAAHGRIAASDARIGLPEVKLGIIPGAGGTQRLPRLIGIPAAIELVSSGRSLGAHEARALGILDRVADGDLVDEAASFARELIGKRLRRTSALPLSDFDRAAAEAAIVTIARKARGQVAPAEAARAVLAAATLPFEQGQQHERGVFMRLVASDQAAALRHLFFAERMAAKMPELEGIAPRAIATVGIAGAGTMGAGIAVAFADAGFNVTVLEQSAEAAAKAKERIEGLYRRAVTSGRLEETACAQRMQRISFAHALTALAHCDLVVEAVFEDLAVKKALFGALSDIVRREAILATNTSYLDPNAIAASTRNPERVLGMHFFAPAQVMRLLEVVGTDHTAPDVLATAIHVARRLGKLPVPAKPCEGYIGNRIFAAYRRHAEYLVEDGAAPEAIDRALEAYGLAMGPFAVADLAGLDIAWAMRRRRAASRPAGERYVAVADRLCEAGRLGRKTGRGWYAYPDPSGRPQPDPDVAAIILAERKRKGVAPRQFSGEEIVRRLLCVMANEGAKVLADGIARRASDIDLVFVNGYGFPGFRGGPMYAADQRGLVATLAEVEAAAAAGGEGSEPAPLLRELAARGSTFAQYDRERSR